MKISFVKTNVKDRSWFIIALIQEMCINLSVRLPVRMSRSTHIVAVLLMRWNVREFVKKKFASINVRLKENICAQEMVKSTTMTANTFVNKI